MSSKNNQRSYQILILTHRLSGFEILHITTLKFQKWLETLKNIFHLDFFEEYERQFSYFFFENSLLWFSLKSYFDFEEKVKMETSALDKNSNMPFLRCEFSEIFEELVTITLFNKWLIFMIEIVFQMGLLSPFRQPGS